MIFTVSLSRQTKIEILKAWSYSQKKLEKNHKKQLNTFGSKTNY